MKKTNRLWLSLLMFVALMIGIIICYQKFFSPKSDSITIEREQQHIVAMEGGADPSLGSTTVDTSGVVDKNFISHLPLVVLEVSEELPITKKVLEDGTMLYSDEDPYVDGTMSIYDSDDYINTLSAEPTSTNTIKIKYRGNYSLNFEKKQYGIKLIDSEGEKVEQSLMGMEASNNWILNISELDQSLIRNYLALNIGSALFEGTPECKYCEVFFKENETYFYRGVYLLMEKVEEGDGRVELSSYTPGDETADYLLCRDRENENDLQLSTMGNEFGITRGRISVLYPKADEIDDNTFEYIQDYVNRIDEVLYSDNEKEYETWSEYIDIKSFSYYFLYNEWMGNYDAGDNSTYMYKKSSGKLCMGPVWDYDGAMDNFFEVANPEHFAFYECAWYEKLVESRKFMQYSLAEYDLLTKDGGIMTAEFTNAYIDDVSKFLGNAALRDRSRWADIYAETPIENALDDRNQLVYRESDDYMDEVDRLKNYFTIKSIYMKDSLKELYSKSTGSNILGAAIAFMVVLLFGCSIVLIRRKESYR